MRHIEIIKTFQLDDKELKNRKIVNIEICPKSFFITRDFNDWFIRTDEIKTMPFWYYENYSEIVNKLKDAFNNITNECISINDEHHIIKNVQIEAYNNSVIDAYGKSIVVLFDNATAYLYDESLSLKRDRIGKIIWERATNG